MIERPDVEKALWSFTGYQGDATAIDGLLTIIDAYALGQAEAFSGAPAGAVTAHLHTLMTLAEQLLDTGGRMKLVPETLPPPARNGVVRVAAPPSAPRPGTAFNEDGTLTCRVCLTPKDPGHFSKDAGMRTGYKSRCKDCDRAARKG